MGVKSVILRIDATKLLCLEIDIHAAPFDTPTSIVIGDAVEVHTEKDILIFPLQMLVVASSHQSLRPVVAKLATKQYGEYE